MRPSVRQAGRRPGRRGLDATHAAPDPGRRTDEEAVIVDTLRTWLGTHGLEGSLLSLVMGLIAVVTLAILAGLADWIAKRIIVRGVSKVITRSRTNWDDALIEHKVLDRLAHLAPLYLLHLLVPLLLVDFPTAITVLDTIINVLMVVLVVATIDGTISAFFGVYQRLSISRRIYLTGIVQVTRFLVFAFGSIIVLSRLLGRSPLVFLSGLGALSAVLLLIFKDAILGFVAGIQLMSNNMVRQGDWIQLPKYDVDGDVLEVTLTTVKVQNWDKTIANVPTYALISDSFRNWRGMSESGGRRIKRSISIDMNTVKFCDQEMLGRFRRIQYLSEYIDRKQKELDEYNKTNDIDTSLLVNGRHMTNLGTFRAYLVEYLRHHPQIHQDMTFLVRQLKPTAEGIPMEIYVFSKDQRWAYYEAIQSDIFDHILAVLPLFDLRPFQSPTGTDVLALRGGTGT
jgi:miniconductance mechanosensitive channel